MPLTNEGLTVRRFPEVLAQLVADERANIDPNIDARDDELLGQLNNIIALTVADLEQVVQSAYDNLDIDLAAGIWLDKLAKGKGLNRQAATASYTDYQFFIGSDGTIVPAGTLITSNITNNKYALTESVEISTANCRKTTYSVNTLLNSTSYDITINSVRYVYTSDGTATKLEVVNGLKALIDADATANWSATVDTGLEEITIISDLAALNLEVTATTYLTPKNVAVYGTIESIVEGADVDVANTLTVLISSVGGLSSTYNEEAVVVGRERETDEEFRIRILESDQSKSVATLPAITSRLRNISGVTRVSVVENDTNITDGDGRPAHSYEVIVSGGLDNTIANEIWQSKPAGIQLHGNTTVLITDSENIQRTIKFTRPVAINLAFKVTYTQYTEETLPASPATLIKTIVDESTDDLGVGKDVIPSRFFGPIYSGVEGLNSLVVEIQQITNPGDTPNPANWQTTKLAISPSQFASTTPLDVSVVAA